MVLTDVHADMSGYYTCEVTTQKTFETVTARQYLLVVREYLKSSPGSGMLVWRVWSQLDADHLKIKIILRRKH